MRGHRLERVIGYAARAGLAAGLAMICIAGAVSIASAQRQVTAVPWRGGDGESFRAQILDLDVPDMPFAERPGAAKSVQPDRWAWIEGCRRYVDARVSRDTALDAEFTAGTRGLAEKAEAASYRRRHMLADCLASATR